MISTKRLPVTPNFPQRFRILWASAESLLHSVASLRTKATTALQTGAALDWPRESRREFYELLEATRCHFFTVRNEASAPWVQVTRLFSIADRTDVALSVILQIQRLADAEISSEQRCHYSEAWDVLTPIATDERAVMLESIHAEIRVAASQIAPLFDPNNPLDFIDELLCSKKVPSLTHEARKWLEGYVASTESLLDAVNRPAPHLDFANCQPLSFVLHRGHCPVDLEAQCASLRRILAATDEQDPRSQTELQHPALPLLFAKERQLQDSFVHLAEWAKLKMKGNQRAIVELVIANGGAIPIPDLAIHEAIDWGDEWGDSWDSARREINNKLTNKGWRLERRDSEAVLVELSASTSPSKMTAV